MSQLSPTRRSRLLVLLLAAALFGSVLAVLPGSPASSATSWMLGGTTDVSALPTSGTGWSAVLNAAKQPITVNLADQDNQSDVTALAAGLVYSRTGDATYKAKVEAALKQVPGTEAGGRTLSLGRQLAGWVLAADLVDYRDPAFLTWLSGVRTKNIGGHGRWYTLSQTHEDTANNWGTFAGASRIAASLYLGDTADVQRAAAVFRGWLGDAAAYDGFRATADFDTSWACGYPAWDPVNAKSCGTRSGALVEDISRGDAYPNATQVGLSYSWEALQGVVLQALLLQNAGYTDVWQWEDQALLRAVQFMRNNKGFDSANFNAVNHWIPFVIDQVYGTTYASGAAGRGRQFGFTDWLRFRSGTTTTTTAAPTTTTTAAPTTTTTVAPTTTTTAPVAKPAIASMQASSQKSSTDWVAGLAVKVTAGGVPAVGAQVTVSWSGSAGGSGTLQCTADSTGTCSVQQRFATTSSYAEMTPKEVRYSQQVVTPAVTAWRVPRP